MMMPFSTTYKQGTVVLVPFPFTDLSTTKKRPAVIISANWYNNSRNDLILAAVTTSIHKQLEQDEYLLSYDDIKQTGIIRPGVIKTGSIFTIEKTKVYKQLGQLPYRSIQKMLDKVLLVLDRESIS